MKEEKIKSNKGSTNFTSTSRKIIDRLYTEKFDAVYYLGIGGTYASSIKTVTYMNGEKQLACLCTACCRILHYWEQKINKRFYCRRVLCYWDNPK